MPTLIHDFLDKSAKWGLFITVFIAFLGLLFRATLYWSIPVADGEAYGLGDVIELFIGGALIFVAGFTVVSGILSIAVSYKNGVNRQSVKSVFFSLIAVVGYILLHSLVPQLM